MSNVIDNFYWPFNGPWPTALPGCWTCGTCGAAVPHGTQHWCSVPVGRVEISSTPAASGWTCPKCLRVYGPSVTACEPCNAAMETPEAIDLANRRMFAQWYLTQDSTDTSAENETAKACRAVLTPEELKELGDSGQ